MRLVRGRTSYCRRCKEIKVLADFQKNRSRPTGVQIFCRPCCAEVDAERNNKPGICSFKGCDRPKHQWVTGRYSRRCQRHQDLNMSQQGVRLADERLAELFANKA